MKGGLYGLLVGIVANLGVFFLTVSCLTFSLSFPWYCETVSYHFVQYFAFPANVLTNALDQAVMFSPLSLLIYVVIGMCIGGWYGRKSRR